MSIIASAPVPAGHRLIDAATAELVAIRRPVAELVVLGRRIWELNRSRPTLCSDKALAQRFKVTEMDVNAAITAYMEASPAEQEAANAACDERARQAWKLCTADGATIPGVAAQLGVAATEVLDLALHHIAQQTGWTPGQRRAASQALPGDPKLCPTWCTVDHTEDGAERLHSREVAEVIAPSGPDMHDQQSISVNLDAFESPELPDGIDPTSIYLVVSGECDAESTASLSPELAEQLAAALFEAARIARQARG